MRRQLSKRDFRFLLDTVSKNGFHLIRDIGLKGSYSVMIRKDIEVIFSHDNTPLITIINENIIPFIGSLDYFSGYKVVYVDEGAVKPITNGADIMAPGIKSGDDFVSGDYLVIKLIKLDVPLAIGKALLDYKSLGDRGKAIKNIHYKGDRIWKYIYEGK